MWEILICDVMQYSVQDMKDFRCGGGCELYKYEDELE